MRHKKRMIVMILPLLGILFIIGAIWHISRADTPDTEVHHEHDHDEDRRDNKHEEEDVIRLSEAEMKEFGIILDTAGSGDLKIHVELPGEVVINADSLAHIVPRVSGIVREVRKNLGDNVHAGEVVAVLESREIADAKAAFLTGSERVELAQANFRREEDLWKKNISSEQEYLEAKQTLAEAKIELRSTEHKLHALGFSDDYLSQLPGHADESFTLYEIIAPFDGTVIEKHITLGEVLKDDSEAFIIADLSSVWVNLNIYQKDLPFVQKEQPVIISAGHGIPDTKDKISYIGPLVGEQTRTALARVVLPNPKGLWRPGIFVTGKIEVEDIKVSLIMPKTAIQTVDGKRSVFIKTEHGFEPQPVTIGRTNDTHVEITSGIKSGQQYVIEGAFTLKAELSKGAFGDGHNH
ncbi:MAG: efflux RND transporter periplasmic adaptor subunit [Nitrospirota bacterium]